MRRIAIITRYRFELHFNLKTSFCSVNITVFDEPDCIYTSSDPKLLLESVFILTSRTLVNHTTECHAQDHNFRECFTEANTVNSQDKSHIRISKKIDYLNICEKYKRDIVSY